MLAYSVRLCWIILITVGTAIDATAQKAEFVINVPKLIHAEPLSETPLPVPIGPADAVPRNVFVRVRGLPPSVQLSEGHQVGEGSWAIPFSHLTTLKLFAPAGSEGQSAITISLVTFDGQILAELQSTLHIAPLASFSANQPRPTAPAQKKASAAPQISTEDQARAEKYVQRADESLSSGNIAVARLFYQRAADLGLAQGALALGMTFDPNELSRWNVVGGIKPDREEARKWYEKARQLGATDVTAKLQRLGER